VTKLGMSLLSSERLVADASMFMRRGVSRLPDWEGCKHQGWRRVKKEPYPMIGL
jgi:hypothetical protein